MTKKELIQLCLQQTNSYEDYPFDENWAAIRHRKNKKSFAYVYDRNGKLRLNLKCDPFEADHLRQSFSAVEPAYHMNKEHWNTITPGEDVSDGHILQMIQHSYDLIKPKEKKPSSKK